MADKKKKPQHIDERVLGKLRRDSAPAPAAEPEAGPPETPPEPAETIKSPPEAPAEESGPGKGPGPEPEPAPAPAQDPGKPAAEEKFLRLAAEYDNYRKRTAKEKESIWTDAKAQTVAAFLPVYDNLERALKQVTSDAAYAKGVEMTMKGLQDALNGLGVETIPALGETFDPRFHNAVMHVDDESAGENTVVEVFQQGFVCGEKVIRFAMVKVAN